VAVPDDRRRVSCRDRSLPQNVCLRTKTNRNPICLRHPLSIGTTELCPASLSLLAVCHYGAQEDDNHTNLCIRHVAMFVPARHRLSCFLYPATMSPPGVDSADSRLRPRGSYLAWAHTLARYDTSFTFCAPAPGSPMVQEGASTPPSPPDFVPHQSQRHSPPPSRPVGVLRSVPVRRRPTRRHRSPRD
jgi:hypothetical protein